MMLNFMISGKLRTLESTEVKNNKNLVVRSCFSVYKTPIGYLLSMMIGRTKTNHVFNQSKRLGDLDLSVSKLNQHYIKILLDNADYSEKHGVRQGIATPDAYKFEVGSEITLGTVIAHDEAFQYYYVSRKKHDRNGDAIDGIEYCVYHWHSMFKNANCDNRIDCARGDIRYYNTTISSLYTKFFSFGIDMNPRYQRDCVWTMEQKVNLIDSIFKSIPIGAIVLAERNWYNGTDVTGDMQECIDGKQRLSTILDFVCGKFKYHDLYYYEMNGNDRRYFDNQQIMIGELKFENEKYDEEKVLRTFIALNIGGTSMDKKVIDEAKEMLNHHTGL